jgi:hypothetical protein
LTTQGGVVVHSGFTQAAQMDWGNFEDVIPISTGLTANQLTLSVCSESAEGGSKMFEVSVLLNICIQ